MEIRHLRYFVAVADTLNFGRAARALHMSQPPLSKRIADLEAELGTRLFDRSRRQITLTAAGRVLLPPARVALDAFDAAARVVRAVPAAQAPRLRLAVPPDTSRAALLEIVERLRARGILVDVSEATTAEQHALLLAGELDVGVLRHPYDDAGLRSSAPLRQTIGVLLDAQHPLAARESLRLDDLARWPLVMFPRPMAPGLYDEILLVCRQHGYAPPRLLHGIRMTSALIVAERAVALATPTLVTNPTFSGFRELAWRPIDGEPLHWWTSAVRRSDDRGAATRHALAITLEVLQSLDGWVPAPRPRRRPAGAAVPGATTSAGTPLPAARAPRR